MIVYKSIYHITKVKDPFKKIKKSTTRKLLKMYPEFKKKIKKSQDPLYTALKFAALANAIDLGANPDFNLNKELKNFGGKDFDVCEYSEFKKALKKAKNILYIADNAGETVFDRLLIEELNRPVKYAVRADPIINDATSEDAQDAGLDKVAEIISSGCEAPGTILRLCSLEFKKVFARADLIISKGQGNYETLSNLKRLIFFLLKLKCPVIARDMGIPFGSVVLIKNKNAP